MTRFRTERRATYVEISREVPGLRPHEVISRFLEPTQVARWWGGELDVDPRIGGHYVVAFPALGQSMVGTVLHLHEDGLAFSWTWGRPAELERRVDVTAVPLEDAGSLLTVRHSPYFEGADERAEAESHLAGWQHFLARID